MGSSDQTGNELDEFVTETLRNNLLGLPLDLPTINMARARDAGIPPLNEVRRQIFARRPNDGQLAPYTSWSDFGQHLKHPESLINFVAAYGTAPDHHERDRRSSDKRAAARAIVDPIPADPTATPPITGDVPPADAADFMFGTRRLGERRQRPHHDRARRRRPVGRRSRRGHQPVRRPAGHARSTTCSRAQLENLQDGDRLYYLNRTPGMNLRTQLEGNSFSELIQRNTDGTNTLEGRRVRDGRLQVPARPPRRHTPPASLPHGATVADDPTTRRATRTCCCCASLTARSSTGRSTPSTRRDQRSGRLQRHRRRRPCRRRQRQRHLLGWRRATTPSRASSGDDVALGGRRQRHPHRPRRRRRPQGWPRQRRHRRWPR